MDRTDARRAVTTSAYGPVSTILLRYLSVFHYRYSSAFPVRSYTLHLSSPSIRSLIYFRRQQFTCPKGHLSEKYRHRVRVKF